MRRDRLTNTRPGKRAAAPCPNCAGDGALLPTPSGVLYPARMVVPNRNAWARLSPAPCPVCRQTGVEPRSMPRIGQG